MQLSCLLIHLCSCTRKVNTNIFILYSDISNKFDYGEKSDCVNLHPAGSSKFKYNMNFARSLLLDDIILVHAKEVHVNSHHTLKSVHLFCCNMEHIITIHYAHNFK
jgi:hypothetical protein